MPDVTDHTQILRTLAGECWSDGVGVERMRDHIAPDYVHHTMFGDWTFAQFKAGLAWVDGVFADRSYDVDHIIVDGDLAAMYLHWRATRRADGSRVEGVGAYHCRFIDGLIAEDWDVFVPTS